MFTEIEKQYKKGLQERRFSAYYWPRAVLIVALALIADFVLGADRWLIYSLTVAALLLFVIIFFVRDIRHGLKELDDSKKRRNTRAKLALYIEYDDRLRIDNLISDLRRHNLNSKDDLKLAINYFERQRPVESKPNLLEWTLSVAVALSSIVLLAYDTDTGIIDSQKFISAFCSTLAIALIVLTPAILAKIISTRIATHRTKVDNFLIEDLAFLYVNFEKFQDRLK